MARQNLNLVLKSWSMITPSVRHFVFTREDGEAANFTPGQFIMIHFDHDGTPTQRSYSISARADRCADFEIAVSFVEGGRATRYLWSIDEGARISATGPLGRFVLRAEQPRRYVLVGTGTGVSPYRAMLPEIRRRIEHENLRVTLLLGVRTRDELLYGEEFAQFAAENPGFEFVACLSRGLPDDSRPYERHGYVQHQFGTLDLDPELDIVYLCGNPNMIDDAVADLETRGYSPYQIRREKYVSGA